MKMFFFVAGIKYLRIGSLSIQRFMDGETLCDKLSFILGLGFLRVYEDETMYCSNIFTVKRFFVSMSQLKCIVPLVYWKDDS